MTKNNTSQPKPLAIVAYITIIGVLVAHFLNQDKKDAVVAFHTRQSLGLWLLYMIFGYIVGGFNSWNITYAFWICFSALFLYGIYGAISNKFTKIPFLGTLFQTIFKSIG